MALDTGARDTEPVLVRVQVGGRNELLVDEVHGQVGAKPQRLEEMPAQARRRLPASEQRRRRGQLWRDGIDGLCNTSGVNPQ